MLNIKSFILSPKSLLSLFLLRRFITDLAQLIWKYHFQTSENCRRRFSGSWPHQPLQVSWFCDTFFIKMMKIIVSMWLLTPTCRWQCLSYRCLSCTGYAHFFMSSLSAYFHVFLLLLIDFEREMRKKYWKIPYRYFWCSSTKSVILKFWRDCKMFTSSPT